MAQNCDSSKEKMKIVFFLLIQFIFVFAWRPKDFPDYCTQDVTTHAIPNLSEEESNLVDHLKQVQVVVRHGARTPYKLDICWKGYDIQWNDCNVSEIMMTERVESLADIKLLNNPKWFFRKVYDGSRNSLGGNCMTGQLLAKGFDQEFGIGTILRDAYFSGDHHLNIFPTNKWENMSSYSFLRSDDEQRTLMSGQTVVRSLFSLEHDAVVDWHTGDFSMDFLYPNSFICPRLNELSRLAYESEDWSRLLLTSGVVDLESRMDKVFGAGTWNWMASLDCMMTAVCSGRDLPQGSEDIFEEVVAHSERLYAFRSLYNHSQWSKLAMSRLAWELRTRILNSSSAAAGSGGWWRRERAHSRGEVPLPGPRFALYAAHDTTIMPLLAALLGPDRWDGRWAGYASLLTFEIYQRKDTTTFKNNASDKQSSLDWEPPSKDLFRVIYNGHPLTLPSCPSPLCPLSVLLDALSFGLEDPSPPCSLSSSVSGEEVPSPSMSPSPTTHSLSPSTLGSALFSPQSPPLILHLLWFLFSLFLGLVGIVIGHNSLPFSPPSASSTLSPPLNKPSSEKETDIELPSLPLFNPPLSSPPSSSRSLSESHHPFLCSHYQHSGEEGERRLCESLEGGREGGREGSRDVDIGVDVNHLRSRSRGIGTGTGTGVDFSFDIDQLSS